jgi:uncharacterized protein (TIGR00106 family)
MDSFLIEFSMFPTSDDCRKGASVSERVSKVIDAIDKSGVKYQLTPMGTVFEAATMDEALAVIALAYKQLDECERVYSSLKFDIRKNKTGRLKSKIDSVERQLNREVSH